MLAAAALTGRLSAQAPAPAPSPPRAPAAHVRFWNLLPPPPNVNTAPASAFVELQLLPGEGQPALASGGPGSFHVRYASVRPGGYNLIVRRPDADPAVGTIARLPANLRNESYITVVVSERDGRPTAELVDDTPDPKAPADAPGRLTVRQCIPGVRVSVLADRRVPTGDLGYGEARSLDGLPNRIVPLAMQSRPATGGTLPPHTWNTEVDFSGPSRRATLLVVADPYGRFRPRVAMDGPTTVEDAEAPVVSRPTVASPAPRPSPTPTAP